MLNIDLRLRLIAVGSCLAAVWLAWDLAQGNYALPALIATLVLGAALARMLRTGIAAVALAVALFGYIVGNRGFAQLMPVPALPLLPAEITLAVAGAWVIIQSGYTQRLPFRKDALNWVVLAWLAVGTVRITFDLRPFGLLAMRDYAMIYYAVFFFVTQRLAEERSARNFLVMALAAACVAQPAAAVLSESFPNFFQTQLVIRGMPLIYFKGDLALTFMGMSAVFLAAIAPGPHRRWIWALATLELLYVIGGENRASMLGCVVALLWLAFSRLRRFAHLQAVAVLSALLLISGLALLADIPWAQGKLDGATERIASLGDFVGHGTYMSEESAMKGDNNRFRSLWWRAVTAETLAQNPLFGLGFGYDLARGFLQEYNPDMAEDFTARSPHSIIVSTFGRMGFTGLAVFLAFCVVLVLRTWRAMRDPTSEPFVLGLWACVWIIFISACFGVVLEGPMGAVVFWILLGLANSPDSMTASEAPDSPAAALTLRPAAGPARAPDR